MKKIEIARALVFVGVFGLAFGACSKSVQQPSATRCDPGVDVFCPCADLSMGTMECADDGQTFKPCVSADTGEVCNTPGFAASNGVGGDGGFGGTAGIGDGGGSIGVGGFGEQGGAASSASTSGAGAASSGGTTASNTTGMSGTTGSGGSAPLECPGEAIDIDLAADATVSGDTTISEDDHEGSCGGFGTPEIAYAVTPQGSGTLTATLTGIGDTDSVLYATIDDCDAGTPLGCSDATGASGAEVLTLEAVAGKTVWIFADAITPGPYSLSLHLDSSVPGDTCPGQPITIALGADVVTAGDTSIATANYKGSDACAVSASTKDVVYSVIPADSGTLTVTMDPTFDGDLYARSGTCTTSMDQLGCSENGGVGAEESMSFAVTQGDKISVFADGANGSAGSFTITFHLE